MHGDKYCYSKVVYINNITPVCIICSIHGEFYQTPKKHLCGQGCPKCAGTKRSSKEEFIEKANKIHDNKYDYSKVVYTNNREKVFVICPEHGEFWVTPHNHLKGRGCPECGKIKRVETWRISNNKPKQEIVRQPKKTAYERGLNFVRKAKEIHNDYYTYYPEEYVNNSIKIKISCPEHGDFYQTPANHLKGKGCPECAKNKIRNSRLLVTKAFIEKAKAVHGDKYDYSKSVYIDAHTSLTIICPKHGEFQQTPNDHLRGSGCQKCVGCEKITVEFFKRRANEIHNNYYSYDLITEIKNNRNKVKIICPIHGVFEISVGNHLRGHTCPSCSNNKSQPEEEILAMLTSLNLNCMKRDRDILNGKELDIYIPSEKLAIEYDGLLWHSEKYRTENRYHLNKLEECNKQGIRLITIFEDEWLEHKNIVIEKIKHILHVQSKKTTFGARQCEIKHIKTTTAREFLDTYHIQGFGAGTVYYGAYNKKNNDLVGVMAFRLDHGKWELTRFATDYHYTCPGLGSKIFKTFINEYNPEYVKSFADRRWTLDKDNNLYTKLGFTLEEIEPPDYSYVFKKQRLHKFNFRKQILHKKYGLPLTMTEKEMCDKIGAYRIWNCGLFKYVWQNKA